MGHLNMSLKEFEEMEVGVFFLKLFYFNQLQAQKDRFQAELARMQTVQLINIQLSREDRITDPREFWPFPWEAPVLEEVSEEEAQKRLENLRELANRELHGGIV